MWFGASIEIAGKVCANLWMGVGKTEGQVDRKKGGRKIKGATTG